MQIYNYVKMERVSDQKEAGDPINYAAFRIFALMQIYNYVKMERVSYQKEAGDPINYEAFRSFTHRIAICIICILFGFTLLLIYTSVKMERAIVARKRKPDKLRGFQKFCINANIYLCQNGKSKWLERGDPINYAAFRSFALMQIYSYVKMERVSGQKEETR